MALSISTITPRTRNIAFAFLISIAFIVTGYTLPNFIHPPAVDAESTEELLRAYAAKDTDADGLPDWQESVYGSDPENANSIQAGLTDKEAVDKGIVKPRFTSATTTPMAPVTDADFEVDAPAPDSLTDQFGKTFLEEYALAAGTGETLDEAGQAAIVERLVVDFSKRVGTQYASTYTAASIQVSSSVSVTEYVKSLEHVLITEKIPEDPGLPTLIDTLIYDGDSSARSDLIALADAYRRMASTLTQIPVPSQLATQHLTLIQSFDTLGKATRLVAGYESDPLATTGALGAYVPTFKNIGLSIEGIVGAIRAVQGEPTANMPGAYLIRVLGEIHTI